MRLVLWRRSDPADSRKRDGPGRRWLRGMFFGLFALALFASLFANVIFYRQFGRTYCEVSEVRLDPYGIKHAVFPPDSGDPSGALVVFFGDSRAQQWPAPRVAGYRFANRGIGGQTSEQVRGRFDAHVKPLVPRLVLVQAGVNDLKTIPLFPQRREEIVSACKSNLREIITRASNDGATVIVTTIFPTGKVTLDRRPYWSPDIQKAIEEVNDDLRRLQGTHVIAFDAWKILQDRGRLRDEYAADTLHLSAKGYEALNAELAKLLAGLPRVSATEAH